MSAFTTPILLLVSIAVGEVPHQPEINQYVAQQMTDLNIPGLSLAIVYKDDVYKNAWGQANVELNVPATNDTAYELASMSKPFLATAAVLLSRNANPPFALEDEIRQHLPELPGAWAGITVRYLLSHLSGIKEYLEIREFSTRREYSDADLLNFATSYPLNFAPGDRLDYTNTGYCVLAMLIERTTGKSYGETLKDRIFVPLGMRSTRVNDSTAIIPLRAAGYSFRFGRRFHADYVARSQLAFADCGVISTTNDLVLWDKEMWKIDSKILPQDLLAQMWTPAKLNDGTVTDYGLGWDLYFNDDGIVCQVAHGGAIEGFRSIIRRYLCDELSVIVLFNCELEAGKNYYFARDVADLVVGRKPAAPLAPGPGAEKRRTRLPRH